MYNFFTALYDKWKHLLLDERATFQQRRKKAETEKNETASARCKYTCIYM